jgi:HK97 family phage portal protein
MGMRDRWRTLLEQPETLSYRTDPTDLSSAALALYELIAERRASFTMEQARRLAPVVRAEALITSIAAQMQPLAYRDGFALPIQPRVVTRPNPWQTRAEFVSQSVLGLLEEGECFWRHGDWDPETGRPRIVYVIPNDQVEVSQRTYLRPLYRWAGQDLRPGTDITHVRIAARAGEIRGHGDLRMGLDALATVAAVESFALDFFQSGGIPSVVIRAAQALTPDQAAALKSQWVTSRSSASEPAVIGNGVSLDFPGTDPQKSQMQESRAYGSTVVARLLGIPPALLLVETSGATITYTNGSKALDDLIRSTVLPRYLAPIEAAWSDLTPTTQVVRFDLGEMQRADIEARFGLYGTGIDKGFLKPEEARAAEGWSPLETDDHAFDPSPIPDATPLEVPALV